MPVVRLPSATPIHAARFAVIGVYAGTDTAVRHVGLLAARRELSQPVSVEVFHQGPPLRIGQAGRAPARITADLVGWLDDMSEDEVAAIEVWLERIRPHVAGNLEEYAIRRCDIVRRHPDTGRTELKFSCVGFVTRAYRSARIEIVIDETRRPALNEAELSQVWDLSALSPRRQQDIRIELGPPPFRILLPGYVMHAFARPTADARSPYTPIANDLYFPHPDPAP